ncbi:MAG: OmpA family protein [Pseudomonadota bacterium]
MAIILAASGYFDRGGSDAADQVVVATPAEPIVSAPAEPATQVAVAPAVVPAPSAGAGAATADPAAQATTVAAAAQPVLDQGASTTGVEVTRAPNIATLSGFGAPSVVESGTTPIVTLQPGLVAPAASAPSTVSPSENAAAFFAAAQKNIQAANSCKDDLAELTAQARVYFPSGGLAADASGIEQARLIGIVAQGCPGVRIQIEGHSDPSGDPAVNLRLSQQRAEQVLQRIGAAGIDTSIFVASGLGSSQPSGLTGPLGRAHYDRRVEFSVLVDGVTNASFAASGGQSAWGVPSCVAQLQDAVLGSSLYYAPKSIATQRADVDLAMALASAAEACPQARLRVVGHHSDEIGVNETLGTGLLRAKALMTMLVARGIEPTQIIIAAPSHSDRSNGKSGSRLDFDVIYEEL